MSCQIRLTANIQDINSIRRFLFPTDDQRASESWLQLCDISPSPTGDLIAIANERKIVVLTSKWDPQSSMSFFQITYSGTLHSYDKIKAVLCLPIVAENVSSYVGPDWTCILVAYDSGYVRFYTENCELLMEEQFHSENITGVKCQSQHSPRPDILPDLHPEEVYIQYLTNVCVINGQQLFAYLRNCRNLLAKGQTNIDSSQSGVNPKKWGFTDQSTIHDCAVVGLNLTSPFDHLLTASTYGGFETKYRATPPNNTLVLAAGSRPFLGYHFALEGGAQPVLSDVAKVVANKLKSALPGWLTGTRLQAEKQMSLAMQPAEAMGCRFGLCDLRRTATDVILSPNKKLAAVSDALGRVLLVDTFRGVVLRIFKGYRDAQCSFIQVPDERKSKHKIGNKVAHFLVIYSPKKGTLEVFSMQQGSRICTFTASKFSRLLHINHGLMGFANVSKSRYICQFTTIFIDNDGQIKEIQVPYHFALSEKNSKRARDIHLYKKLRQLIRNGECDEEQLLNEAYNTVTELKTIEIKTQVVELLTSNRNVSAKAIMQCAQYIADNSVDDDCVNLKHLCENLVNLLRLYLFVTAADKDDENGNESEATSLTVNVDSKNMKNLQRLLDLSIINDTSQLPEVHVSFSDNVSYTTSEFISSFDTSKQNENTLRENIDDGILFRTSEVLFKRYVTGELSNFGELQTEILRSKITTENLFDLLINYWVNRSFHINLNLEKEMQNLSNLIYILVQNADRSRVVTDYNEISVFWSKIREILADSYRPFPALMAAILCKNVAQKLDTELSMNDSTSSLEEGIEVLSQENVQWSLLIGKLEDVSLLNIVLSTKPAVKDCSMPKLKPDDVNISLKYVMERGRGSVSELVARWLSSCGVNPQNLILNENLGKLSQPDVSDEAVVCEEDVLRHEKVFEQLNLLRSQFPYSVESSALLANMSWEYATAWQRDIQDLGLLEAAIQCAGFVQSVRIKQGLYQLLWNTHLKIVNESACKLINKVGRLPKERLCKQDTGLTDYQLSLFIGISTDFLDRFMDVALEENEDDRGPLKFENIWDNGGQPLVQMAHQQRQVNYDLLHLHYQLSTVLQMITTFAVKHAKPVNSLFEASVVGLLFTDFQRKIEVNWNKSDIKINSSRIHFLLKIISASMESVTVNQSGSVHSTEHIAWMSKCMTLARIWNLDIDIFKRYQVVKLYTNGFDSLAEELMPSVTDRKELGSHLLAIAARRLANFLTTSPDLGENISALSPTLTKYMESLDEEWCKPSELRSITNLATHTLSHLTEDQSEHKLAQLILEAANSLEEIHSYS